MAEEHGAQTGRPTRSVVVGVTPDGAPWTLQVAADYALTFSAALTCVVVDAPNYAVRAFGDTGMLSIASDPSTLESDTAFRTVIHGELRELLDPLGVTWSLRVVSGDPASALIDVADEIDALMLVVGARPSRPFRPLQSGSIALRLSHRQYRPVVVVPVGPDLAGRRPHPEHLDAEEAVDPQPASN